MRKIELQNKSGRICVQFSYCLQRYSLYGLGDWNSHSDKAKAESLVRVIEADVLEKRFDTTLERYKQGLSRATKSLGTPIEMFAQWVESLKVSEKTYNTHYAPVAALLVKGSTYSFACKPVLDYWEHLAPSSYNGRIGYLRRFGKWLVDEGYLSLNPYRSLKPRKGSPSVYNPFTASEVALITAELYSRSKMVGAYYHFLFLTGCRPSEALGLLWDKVNYIKETVTIDSALARSDSGSATAVGRVRKPTKTGDVRVFPLSVELERCLLTAYDHNPLSTPLEGLVFCNSRGTCLDDTNLLERHWKPSLAKLGLPYRRPYFTRHTAASTVIENGGTLADAAKLLGHSDLRMVSSVYGHAVKPIQLPSYSEQPGESTT